MTTRTATIWIPDWPLIVALAVNNLPPNTPAVVATNKRVTVASGYARQAGIRTNMPLRHAQELLPQLHILNSNEPLETKEFEYIAQLIETLIPHLDIIRPGLLTFGANGPTRYFKTEEALADKITDLLAREAQVESYVGFADGLLASVLSARSKRPIPTGQSLEFLQNRPLSDVRYALASRAAVARVTELIALWDRLGIRTFGQLAQLPGTKVHTRFGDDGLRVYELAHGKDIFAGEGQRTKPEIIVEHTLEHPATRVDEAAFYARRLSQQMYQALVDQSATCGRMQVSARMSDGTELHRSWRTDASALGGMSPERMTQRVRWQLEGWLTNSALRERSALLKEKQRARDSEREGYFGRDERATSRSTRSSSRYHSVDSGSEDLRAELEAQERIADSLTNELVWLQLMALDVIGAATHQESLWGGSAGTDVKAHRAAERLASLIGPHNVQAVRLKGGRTYRERIMYVPWDDDAIDPDPVAVKTIAISTAEASIRGGVGTGGSTSASVGTGVGTPTLWSADRTITQMTTEPWPGQLPKPAPATVLDPPQSIEVVNAHGELVWFSNRLIMSSTPCWVRWNETEKPPTFVTDWAGPWPITTRWWQPTPQRMIYLQLVTEHHPPLLVAYSNKQWTCEGIYD